jgi:hypothetical protein
MIPVRKRASNNHRDSQHIHLPEARLVAGINEVVVLFFFVIRWHFHVQWRFLWEDTKGGWLMFVEVGNGFVTNDIAIRSVKKTEIDGHQLNIMKQREKRQKKNRWR